MKKFGAMIAICIIERPMNYKWLLVRFRREASARRRRKENVFLSLSLSVTFAFAFECALLPLLTASHSLTVDRTNLR